jgi:hypothetical protein
VATSDAVTCPADVLEQRGVVPRQCSLSASEVALTLGKAVVFRSGALTLGVYLSRRFTERRVLSEIVNTLTRATGRSPRGWLGPGLSETPNTPRLLAKLGFT